MAAFGVITEAEGCVGRGRSALYGRDLSAVDAFIASAEVRILRRDAAESLCHARHLLACRGPEPIGVSQPDRLSLYFAPNFFSLPLHLAKHAPYVSNVVKERGAGSRLSISP